MDQRDKQIALLNINTAAAQLAAASGATGVDLLDQYDAFFEHLQNKVFGAIQTGPTPIQQLEKLGTYVDTPEAAPQPTAQSTLKVLGQQHGDLPAWLIEDAAKAGVTAVFDNRVDRDGKPVAGTNRPWFKEAVGRDERGHGKDGEAKAFWPPKGR